MKRAACVIVLALSACGHRAQPVDHPTAAHCEVTSRAEVAGVLRNDGRGWYALADDHHAPLNIASVHTNPNNIEVRFTFRAQKVLTFIATPDETLARQGLSVGASVDTDRARVYLARGRMLDPMTIDTARYPWSNLWVYGLFEGAKC